MKLIIDIPSDVYKNIERIKKGFYGSMASQNILNAVANGTPLPKGHGKIIDESQITTVYYHEEKAERGVINFRGIVIDGTDAPTIIESDRGGKDIKAKTKCT